MPRDKKKYHRATSDIEDSENSEASESSESSEASDVVVSDVVVSDAVTTPSEKQEAQMEKNSTPTGQKLTSVSDQAEEERKQLLKNAILRRNQIITQKKAQRRVRD